MDGDKKPSLFRNLISNLESICDNIQEDYETKINELNALLFASNKINHTCLSIVRGKYSPEQKIEILETFLCENGVDDCD